MTSAREFFWRWMVVPLVCGVLTMTGCSRGRPPIASLSQAELAIQEAEKRQAFLLAPVEFQTAREQYLGAQRAMEDKKYKRARHLAEQALVNAQLAEAKGEAEKVRFTAEGLRKSIQALRAEIERAPSR
jgi:hypothetical protein